MLCCPQGAPAARLLPHVDDVVACGGGGPGLSDESGPEGVLRRLRAGAYDVALALASADRSPRPLVDLMHRAQVRPITGAPHGVGRRRPPSTCAGLTGNGPYVVLQPGRDALERTADADRCAETVGLLADAGHRVVVTGGPDESALTRAISDDTAVDLGGRTDARTLAGVLRAADVVVAGEPGPAHLAAATGTPVVSLSCPVLPAERRAPYGVPRVLLGDRHDAPGRSGHEFTARDVVRAVQELIKEGV
ncbi:glycosyltransferase family 9 protein [Streptomyces bluensis]|uniref:glycosyltransferase family 9 protein n=1 Tax=Streptomyces bluensis TaxID=33897 RepID=UPI0036810DC3